MLLTDAMPRHPWYLKMPPHECCLQTPCDATRGTCRRHARPPVVLEDATPQVLYTDAMPQVLLPDVIPLVLLAHTTPPVVLEDAMLRHMWYLKTPRHATPRYKSYFQMPRHKCYLHTPRHTWYLQTPCYATCVTYRHHATNVTYRCHASPPVVLEDATPRIKMSIGENNQILTCFITKATHFCDKQMYYFYERAS